ncbi:MAG: hypothetical protein A2Z27_03030 [candidate division Zixibacteria bacterium RBG_16_50_21]|nr:MAG: hypothetical protein A2Z27_03030 [candidate division Zixibacteria bacterium RBG_16_50_21]
MNIETLGIWLGAFFTLCIFSFLYKDNPFYKLAEHVFVGISAGYGVALEFQNVFLPNLWNPLTKEGKLIMLVPLVLGVLLFTRFVSRISWLSRWSIGLLIGIYSGIAIIGFGSGDLVAQIHGNLLPLWGGNDLLTLFNNWILTVGLITCLIYFFFSKEHKGSFGILARVGIYFLMLSFGASFGYTVMSRMSLLIGRFYFLYGDWLGILPQ